MPAFRVKLGASDLNCVDVPLNPTHSLTRYVIQGARRTHTQRDSVTSSDAIPALAKRRRR